MNRKQFAVIVVFTAMETYFFNEATMAGQMLFACFWALLILRNLQMAYMVEKIASAIEKEIKKKRKWNLWKEILFQRFFSCFKRLFGIVCGNLLGRGRPFV